MTRRATNAVLIAAVALLVATGIAGWTLPESVAAPVYPVHRVLGLVLLLTLAWKYRMAARGVRTRVSAGRASSVALGSLTAALLIASLGIGVAWSLGLVSFDRPVPYSPLNVHVFAGLALLPLVAVHAFVRRRQNTAGRGLDRRSLLRLGIVTAAAAVLVPLGDLVAAPRRHTGSRHAGSFTGNDFPLTIWQFDDVPALDARDWTLTFAGRFTAPGPASYRDIADAAQRTADAVLDCTGGWWSEQRWTGAALLPLLRERGLSSDARSIDVVSVTGHRWSFTPHELADAILATHVGGEVLTAGHGHPARLVVPGRRGFQWVKWVARIEAA